MPCQRVAANSWRLSDAWLAFVIRKWWYPTRRVWLCRSAERLLVRIACMSIESAMGRDRELAIVLVAVAVGRTRNLSAIGGKINQLLVPIFWFLYAQACGVQSDDVSVSSGSSIKLELHGTATV